MVVDVLDVDVLDIPPWRRQKDHCREPIINIQFLLLYQHLSHLQMGPKHLIHNGNYNYSAILCFRAVLLRFSRVRVSVSDWL